MNRYLMTLALALAAALANLGAAAPNCEPVAAAALSVSAARWAAVSLPGRPKGECTAMRSMVVAL